MNMKVCAKCGEQKQLSEFHRSSHAKDGRIAKCKACAKTYDEQRGQTLHRKARLAYKDAKRARKRVEAKTGGEIPDTLTFNDVLTTLSESNCAYCGKELAEHERTLEHLTPLKNGGVNEYANITCACGRCNSAKNDTPALIYMIREVDDWQLIEQVMHVADRKQTTFVEAYDDLADEARRYFASSVDNDG